MPPRLFFAGLALVWLAAFCHFDQWRTVILRSDSWGYYLHLPATWVYHDVGNYDRSIAAWRQYNPTDPDPKADRYGLRPTPTGALAIKYPVGVALLESPFFALAQVCCQLTGRYPADGFSLPYLLLAGLSTLFYALLGLILLYRLLRAYFSSGVVQLTIATLALATNLFFFSTYTVGMAHPCAFFLLALLLRAVDRWYRAPGYRDAVWIGAALGLLAATRAPDVVAGVGIVAFWGLCTPRTGGSSQPNGVAGRAQVFWQKRKQLAVAVATGAAAFAPQLLYWKTVSGQWLYYGYQGEKFHWTAPEISNGLFSFQNGWLVYTPVMVLALAGIFWLRRHAAAAFWPLALVLPPYLYITYSWWCWQYINGFGSRPMVDLYPLLAFPLAALVAEALARTWSRLVLGGLLVFCTGLNLFQTVQIDRLVLVSEQGNRAYYQAIFGQWQGSAAAFAAYETGEIQPDSSRFKSIKTLILNPMEDSTDEGYTREIRRNGQFGYRCSGEFCQTGVVATDTADLQPGDWLRASVSAFVRPGEAERRIDNLAKLVVEINSKQRPSYKNKGITISSRIGNPTHILWHGGEAGQWGRAAFFLRVPPDYQPGGVLKVYVWNAHGQRIYLDDLRLERLR